MTTGRPESDPYGDSGDRGWDAPARGARVDRGSGLHRTAV